MRSKTVKCCNACMKGTTCRRSRYLLHQDGVMHFAALLQGHHKALHAGGSHATVREIHLSRKHPINLCLPQSHEFKPQKQCSVLQMLSIKTGSKHLETNRIFLFTLHLSHFSKFLLDLHLSGEGFLQAFVGISPDLSVVADGEDFLLDG